MMLENFSKIRILRNDCNNKIFDTDIQMAMKRTEDLNLNLN